MASVTYTADFIIPSFDGGALRLLFSGNRSVVFNAASDVTDYIHQFDPAGGAALTLTNTSGNLHVELVIGCDPELIVPVAVFGFNDIDDYVSSGFSNNDVPTTIERKAFITSGCEDCLRVEVETCADTIPIVGLPPEVDLMWVLEDMALANRYSGGLTSSAEGNAAIDPILLPDQYLSIIRRGEVIIRFFDDNDDQVTLTVNGKEYGCVSLSTYGS